MQNPIIPQAQKELIENEPIVFDLQLDEFGYPTNLTEQYPFHLKALKSFHWLTGFLEIVVLFKNPPSLDYEFMDWFGLIILTLTNLALFMNLHQSSKKKRFRCFNFNEEKIEWRMTIFDGKSVAWKDIRKVVIWTDEIEVFTYRTPTNRRYTIPVKYIYHKETRLHAKLAIRALCIKLNIHCEENPDCKKEQKLRRKIIKKNEKKGNNKK